MQAMPDQLTLKVGVSTVRDALNRFVDGMTSENDQYAMAQLSKAEEYVKTLRWLFDRYLLVRDHDRKANNV